MIELHYLIPRRFLESSPFAQGCVFDILKVFIKRAAGVAGKILCFVIVSLPMFFHLKNCTFSIPDHEVVTRGHQLSSLWCVNFKLVLQPGDLFAKKKWDASKLYVLQFTFFLIQLFRNKWSWLYLLCHCGRHSIGVGLDPRVELEKVLDVHRLLADQRHRPRLSFIGHGGHLDRGLAVTAA